MNCLTINKYLTAAVLIMVSALHAPAENVLGIEGGDATTVGIYIKELTTGKVLASHNASLALTPASVTKAVTTATALSTLGADFRFTTDFVLTGSRSSSDRARWDGDLLVLSSGDPTLGSSEFSSTKNVTDSVIAGVRRLGITSISGSVIVVEDMKDPGPCPTWECEDIAWPYGAALYGFNYRGNCVRAYPDKGTTVPASDLKITVRTSDGSSLDQLRGIGSDNLTVWAPAATRRRQGWSINTTNPNPAATYTVVLARRLSDAGISMGGKPSGAARQNPQIVYRCLSPRADEICRSLMKRSDNLFAEGMLRAIDPDGSRDDCIDAEKDFWTDNGISARFTVIRDGSGLTRSNRFSPEFLGRMLEYMAASPLARTYVDCFPVAGVDGTMKSFGAKTTLKGRLALKTGSLSSVHTYAGYRLSPKGTPTHVVVVMVNGFFCSRTALKNSIVDYLLDIFKTR